jgi:hypothetical protein
MFVIVNYTSDTYWVTAKIRIKFRPPKFRINLDQI